MGKVGPNRELIHTRVKDLAFIDIEDGMFIFEASVDCDFVGHQGYCVRVVPYHEDVAIPSELNLVTWES